MALRSENSATVQSACLTSGDGNDFYATGTGSSRKVLLILLGMSGQRGLEGEERKLGLLKSMS